MNTARHDTSAASTSAAPALAAATDNAPLPDPMSNTEAPAGIAASRTASRNNQVSACGA